MNIGNSRQEGDISDLSTIGGPRRKECRRTLASERADIGSVVVHDVDLASTPFARDKGDPTGGDTVYAREGFDDVIGDAMGCVSRFGCREAVLSGVESVPGLDIVDVRLHDQIWADDAHIPEDEVIGARGISPPGGKVDLFGSRRPILRMETSANEIDNAREVEIAREDITDERRGRGGGFVPRDEIRNGQRRTASRPDDNLPDLLPQIRGLLKGFAIQSGSPQQHPREPQHVPSRSHHEHTSNTGSRSPR